MKKFYRIFMILLSLTCIFAVSSCDKVKIENNETENNKSKENTANTEISKRDRVTAEGIVVLNDGSYLIIENGAPIEMHIRGDKSSFEELTTGDVIKIERDSQVMESFPGQVFVYSCEKISDGNVYDIPAELLSTLSELGWVKERDSGENDREIHETVKTEECTFSDGNVKMSIRIPDGWCCEKFDDNETRRGLVIYSKKSTEDKLEYMYYPNGFATCGTDRRDVQSVINGKEAVKMYYGDSQIWTFIVSGNFAIINMMDDDTFLSLRDDIEFMEGSVKFEMTN